jgi:hypothetical protein
MAAHETVTEAVEHGARDIHKAQFRERLRIIAAKHMRLRQRADAMQSANC